MPLLSPVLTAYYPPIYNFNPLTNIVVVSEINYGLNYLAKTREGELLIWQLGFCRPNFNSYQLITAT